LGYVAIIVMSFPSMVLSEMPDNIKEAAKEAKNSIKTSHLVCIKEEYYPNKDVNSPSIKPETRKIIQINGRTIVEEDIIIDCAREKAKMVCSDLRDIPELLKTNNLNAHLKRELSRDRTSIIKDRFEMVYKPLGDAEPGEPNNANLMLYGQGEYTKNMLKLPYLGIIDANLLDEKYSPVISEISVDGKNLIQIDISYETPGGVTHGTIQCDPQIQYRYRSIVWTNSKGEKKSEVTASDYKDVNGIPYPFSYVIRRFVNGQLYSEETYNFQKVQFNVSLNDQDFMIFVPKGTPLLDLAISSRVTMIGLERYMGIEEALTIGRNMAQTNE
jgi:hypothetical protein